MLDCGLILVGVGKKIVIMQNGKVTVSHCLLSFIPPVSAVHK